MYLRTEVPAPKHCSRFISPAALLALPHMQCQSFAVQAAGFCDCMMSIQALTAVSLHIRFYNGDWTTQCIFCVFICWRKINDCTLQRNKHNSVVSKLGSTLHGYKTAVITGLNRQYTQCATRLSGRAASMQARTTLCKHETPVSMQAILQNTQ